MAMYHRAVVGRWSEGGWEAVLAGAVSFIFLIPVPVFATLTFTTFTLTSPGGGAPDWSRFNQVGSVVAVDAVGGTASGFGSDYVLTGMVIVSGAPNTVSYTLGGGGGLAPFSNIHITNNGTDGTGLTLLFSVGDVSAPANQFTTGNQPPATFSLSPSLGPFADGNYLVTLTFHFDANTQWTTPDSPSRIRVQFGP
jgi:hypothetical protein